MSDLGSVFLWKLRDTAGMTQNRWAKLQEKPMTPLDHARMSLVLRHAEELYNEPIGRGIHRPYRVRLKTGEKIEYVNCAVAVMKTVHCQYETKRYCQSMDPRVTGPEREILAYELDRVMGFDLVPPTVGRHVYEIGFGSLQAWVEQPLAVDWRKKGYHYKEHPENPWLHRLAAYDFICGQIDRHCLPAGASVKTRRGHVPVERVRVGDEVLTHLGRWRRVLRVFSKPYDGELVEFTCRRTYERLRLTPEHTVPVMRKTGGIKGDRRRTDELGPLEWVHAGEISRDHVLLYPRTTGVDQPVLLPVPMGNLRNRRSYRLAREFLVDERLAALAGWYLAEGHVNCPVHKGKRYATSVGFSFGEHEVDFVDEVVALVRDYLGAKATLRHDKKLHVTQVTVYNAAFARFMLDSFGKGAANKRVADWVLGCGPQFLGVLLDRYAKGDASWDKDYIRLRTVSFELAHQLRDMLLKIGEFPCIRSAYLAGKHNFQGRIVRQRTLWEVNYRRGGPLHARYDVAGFLAAPISDIERVPYKGLVYDLEVEEDHTFCTPTVAVHNSANWILDKHGRVYAIDNGYSFVKNDDRRFLKCNVGKYLVGHKVHPLVQDEVCSIDEKMVVQTLRSRGFQCGEEEGVLKRLHEMRDLKVWGVMGDLWRPD